MRVKELIAALSGLDWDAVVYTEGCDCEGLAGAPTVNGGTVTVTRLPNCTCEPGIDGDDIGDTSRDCETAVDGVCDCKRCHQPLERLI